jgi:CubicO group peptidase (beta-lactamase class C family)
MDAILHYLRWACALALFVQGAHAQAPAIEALQAQLKANGNIRALLIAKGDKQVFEYLRADTRPDTLLPVASVTKSVVSLLAGIAADRGLLNVDEPLAAFFPEHAQGAAAAKLSRVTLRHLLTMSSGFDRRGLGTDTDYPDFALRLYAPNLLQHALGRDIVTEPGSRFYYSNIDSHLVAVAVSRRVKQPLRDFARSELFKPLGIDAFEWAAGTDGVPDGAAGLQLTAPALLRIGKMMRDGGTWQGKQVVSKPYAVQATKRQLASDLPPRGSPELWGYGYLWWTSSTPVDDRPAFYAAGYGGQFIYVVPSLDVVIVAVTAQSSREVAARTALVVRDYALPAAR